MCGLCTGTCWTGAATTGDIEYIAGRTHPGGSGGEFCRWSAIQQHHTFVSQVAVPPVRDFVGVGACL